VKEWERVLVGVWEGGGKMTSRRGPIGEWVSDSSVSIVILQDIRLALPRNSLYSIVRESTREGSSNREKRRSLYLYLRLKARACALISFLLISFLYITTSFSLIRIPSYSPLLLDLLFISFSDSALRYPRRCSRVTRSGPYNPLLHPRPSCSYVFECFVNLLNTEAHGDLLRNL
jgi:hypothetical protein